MTCVTRTVRGNACHQAPLTDFPCCRNHLGHWCVDDSARLIRVFTLYAGRVGPVWPRCGSTCGRREVRDAPEVQVFIDGETHRGVPVRMHLDDASVIADLLTSIGDDAGTRILLAIAASIAEWPERMSYG